MIHVGGYEVTEVAELHANALRSTTLRWWNGKHPYSGMKCGVVLAPIGADASHIANKVVHVKDPRAAFIELVNELHPHGVPVEVSTGRNVEVHPTAVLGKDGFGYQNGVRFPHVGHVHLGNNVHIGAHTCVDRGTLGYTVVGNDTKVDNLVHIAHNVRIGERCTIVAGTVIGGSAIIGNDVFIGINASIKNGVRIGDGATVGMGAVVLHDVPAGATVVGNPARILHGQQPTASSQQPPASNE